MRLKCSVAKPRIAVVTGAGIRESSPPGTTVSIGKEVALEVIRISRDCHT